jgi:2-C-methyl-D-erythritol 4-phosphate cytidylyltransferase
VEDEEAPALGVVLDRNRGSLPYDVIHGEPLVACATWALEAAGVRILDLTTPWDAVQHDGTPLVYHDALCPMTPPAFLVACVRRAVADDAVVAGVLPVTDTVKEVVETAAGPVVGATRDRDALLRLVSPLVLPPSVVEALDDWPSDDLVESVTRLGRRHPVVWLPAPGPARRVRGPEDLAALAALTGR